MMTTLDNEQVKLAERITERICSSDPSAGGLVHLGGKVGSGKTTVLRLTAERLRLSGFCPVFLPTTQGEPDSGVVALSEAADALQAAGFLNGEAVTIWNPQQAWGEKVSALKCAIDRHRESVVVLCDEPRSWYGDGGMLGDDIPESSIEGLANWFVNEAPCRRIVSGELATSLLVERFFPPPLTKPEVDMSSTGTSEAIRAAEAELCAILSRRDRQLTPLNLGIGLALTRFLSPADVVRRLENQTLAHALIAEFFDQFESDPALCAALCKAAMLRTAIPAHNFTHVLGELPDWFGRIVEHFLCEKINGSLKLHLAVQREVLRRRRNIRGNHPWRLRREMDRQFHRDISAEFGGGTGSELRRDVESLYHGLLGDPAERSSGDSRLHCVEQLRAIGRALSYLQRDHESAAGVFELALNISPDDAYSHHYLAFNLDWLAKRESEVELHYQRAIDLRSLHPWYWSRWISYLVTRGQAAAARQAWDRANDVLCPSEQSPAWLFLALHRWVARWLLHWGQLDFAENVLSAIPETVSDSDASVRTLKDLLLALRQAEQGRSVYPLSIPASEWWSPNPRTDLPLEYKGERLRKWLPARVDSVDVEEGEVFLTTGEKASAGDEDPIYREMILTREEIEESAHNWSWDDLGEGRFVELGYYGGDRPERIGLHRTTEWRDRHLLPLVPPPDRWYQRAVTQSWTTENRGE